MLIRALVCLLIFKTLVTDCNDDNIVLFDVYYIDENNLKKYVKFDEATKTFIGGKTSRIVLDLLQKIYIASGRIYFTGSITDISGRCEKDPLETKCAVNEPNYNDFQCNSVCRYLIFTGDMTDITIEVNGYYTYDDMHLGCFNNQGNRAETGTISDCQKHCKTKSQTYFALQQPLGQISLTPKCFCFNNIRSLTQNQLRFCDRMCSNAQERLCGGSEVFSMYAIEPNRGIKIPFDCAYQKERCDDCPNGRSGINCDIINCFKNDGNCGEGLCDFSNLGQSRLVSVCVCGKGTEHTIAPKQVSCQDVDECKDMPCEETSSICKNLLKSYQCECKTGFTETGPNTCKDIDECVKGQHNCHVTSTTCVNIPGTYTCDCKNGFIRENDMECTDIDECSQGICDKSSSTCHNSLGSYKCDCIQGYTRVTQTSCKDIDECLTKHYCHSVSTTCKNNPGSYYCICKSGFGGEIFVRGDFLNCADIDECKDLTACDSATTTCQNTEGSFECNCKGGFARSTKTKCEDTDECSENPCDQSSTVCMNNVGSYSCDCITGYVRETNFKCGDEDECTQRQPCDTVSTDCNNIPGSYICKCKTGFEKETSEKCADIDECERLLHKCGKQAQCTNNMGSYTCGCPPGTEALEYKYSMECHDIDECKGANECDLTISICLNVIKGYVCQCFQGYINVDNFTCRPGSLTTRTTTPYQYEYYDEEIISTKSDTSTEKRSGGQITEEYWLLLPLFILFVISVCLWGYVMPKNEQSRASSSSAISGVSYGSYSLSSRT